MPYPLLSNGNELSTELLTGNNGGDPSALIPLQLPFLNFQMW